MRRGRLVVSLVALALIAGVGWLVLRNRGRPRGEADTTRASTTQASIKKRVRTGDAAVDPRRSPRAAIAGRVVDEQGAPVAGAQVCGTAVSWELSSMETRDPVCALAAADGTYRLESLLAARWSVDASAPGFQPRAWRGRERWETIDVAPGETRTGIDITLKKGGVEVRGRVLDVTGGPVSEAWVSINGDWMGGGGSVSGRADRDGEFALWTTPGPIYVGAEADGYSRGWSEATAPSKGVVVLLTPESVLVGRVVAAGTNEPVPGALVTASLRTQGPSISADGGGSALTGDDGRFRIDRLAAGRYHVGARADDGYGEARESVLVGLGQTSDEIAIELHGAAIVSGRVVVEPGGAPCESGSVSLSPSRPHGRGAHAEVEKDGSFRARAVLPGEYVVEAHCRAKISEERYPNLTVGTEDVGDLRYVVRDGRAIRGVVVHADGKPSRGGWIDAHPEGVDARAHQTRGWGNLEEDGTFEIAGLLPGEYRVAVQVTDGVAPEEPARVTVAPDRDTEGVTISLAATGSIAGTVVDEDGAPQAGVEVSATGKRWTWGASTRTTDDGGFELKSVTPGEARVSAARDWSELRAPGKTDDDLPGERVIVKAGQTVRVRLVVERQTGVIRGRVVDSKGAAVVDAFVSATRQDESAGASAAWSRHAVRWTWGEKPVVTDVDGSFTIEKLSPGKYVVRADRRGGGEALAEGVESGSTITLTIAETASIAGTVAIAGGASPDIFSIAVRDEASGYSRDEGFFRTGGAWRVRDLPPGSYRVSVSAAEGNAEQTIALAQGERREGIALVLAPRATIRGKVIALEGGAPVPGMRVMATPAKSRSFISSSRGRDPDKKYITGADGSYVIDDAPSGRVIVSAFPMDWEHVEYYPSRIYLTVPGGGTVDAPPIRAVKARVKMMDEEGDLGFTLKEAPPGSEPGEHPLEVSLVRADGPAARSGLVVGDVIVSVDGQDVSGENQMLYHPLARVPEGTTVKLGLARGVEVSITAGPPP